MAAALKQAVSEPDEIDMERVVSDAEYRRRIIGRLRRERLMAQLQHSDSEPFDAATGDED